MTDFGSKRQNKNGIEVTNNYKHIKTFHKNPFFRNDEIDKLETPILSDKS